MHACYCACVRSVQQVAYQLFNFAMAASHNCYKNIHVNGSLKKVAQDQNMWPSLVANARDGDIPTNTLAFDFFW